MPSQKRRRLAERAVRMSAVATLGWMRRRGEELADVGRHLGVSPDTLRVWQRRWKADQMRLKPRGRPAQHPDRQLRAEILALFALMGPHVGLPHLQEVFPEVARGELVELQKRYRFAYRRKRSWLMYTLRWQHAGRVWAADFADPPTPIEGVYKKLLAVRDLASGKNLMALPADTADGAVVKAALRALFVRYGAPLVFKSDNGGPFISSPVEDLLASADVLHLLSPPYTPAYNGAVEAGIGALKTRAHFESARNDRPGQWSCDDVEAARLQANHTAHLDGPLCPTPQQAWAYGSPVTPTERDRFLRVYDERVCAERARCEQLELPFRVRVEAAIDRVAISQALIEGGYLLVRRRRISPPFVRRRVAKIS